MAHDSSIRGNITSPAFFEGLDFGHPQKKENTFKESQMQKKKKKNPDNLGHFFAVTDTNEALLYHHSRFCIVACL